RTLSLHRHTKMHKLMAGSKQRHLLREGAPGIFPNRSTRARRSNSIFLLKLSHQGSQMLAVPLRAKIAFSIKLLIIGYQVRKFLANEGQKHGSRARLQEQWISKDIRGMSFGSSLHQGLQVLRLVGNPWKDR